jgi:integrase
MTRRRNDFGSLRRLPSGRWQARYRDPNGRVQTARRTFDTRADAAAYLAGVRTDVSRGARLASDAGQATLAEFSASWLEHRRVRGQHLAPRTAQLYRGLLDNHVLPRLGTAELRNLDTNAVRAWHRSLVGPSGPGASTSAKAYRLLHAICSSAVDESEILHNPCVVAGAGQEPTSARPSLTVQDVAAITEAIGPRWRALVLLAAYSGLRFGELAALRRHRLDLEMGTVAVEESVAELRRGVRHVGPPKSRAGRRVVAIPPHILETLTEHVAAYAEPEPRGLIFVGPKGGPLRSANFGRGQWRPALDRAGLTGIHFHDLRAFAATMAAVSGATTAELMRRLGHSSPDMAMRYQRATAERDAALARGVSRVATELPRTEPPAL